MERCIIITSYLEGKIEELIEIDEDDYVICADGGYTVAKAAGIKPSIVIGDFDSGNAPKRDEIPAGIPVIEHPSHKDYTDTGLALDFAKEQGYRNIMVIGGFGGRLDHTIANIQNLFYFYDDETSIMMIDGKNIAFPLKDADTLMPKMEGYKLSLFAMGGDAKGVTVQGVEYPLNNAVLRADFPLGVSNEIIDEDAYIKVEDGSLIVIMSRD